MTSTNSDRLEVHEKIFLDEEQYEMCITVPWPVRTKIFPFEHTRSQRKTSRKRSGGKIFKWGTVWNVYYCASTNQNQDIFLLCQSGAKARREWHFPPKDRILVCGSAGMELFTKKYQSRAQTRKETRHKEPRGNEAINCPRGIKRISHT